MKNIASSTVFVVLLIAVVIVLFLIGFDIFQARHYAGLVVNFFKRLFRVNTTKVGNNYTEADAKEALLAIKKKYGDQLYFGLDIPKTVEKMYRLETAHFKSQQYKLTGTAGMEAGAWGKYVPAGLPTVKLRDPILGMRDYIVWNPLNFAFLLAEYIIKYEGNFARWNSLKPDRQLAYKKKVEGIKARFV